MKLKLYLLQQKNFKLKKKKKYLGQLNLKES